MSLQDLSSLNSLLSDLQVNQLKQLASELSPIQLAWVAGYLSSEASFASMSSSTGIALATNSSTAKILTILYGSQTGNGRGIAEELAAKVKEQGYQVNLSAMGEYNHRQLKQETLLTIVVSTHGEGEAPDDAIEFYQFLNSKRAPKLDNLSYAVLGLGDSSYEQFCQTGKDFDKRLVELGAKALITRCDCDVDYEQDADSWQQSIITEFSPLMAEPSDSVIPFNALENSAAVASSFTKQNPYVAEIITTQKITARNSDKNIFHIEIDLENSNLRYQPGDALGLWFTNSAALVDEILKGLKLNGSEQVTINDETLSLTEALASKKELTQLSPNVIRKWAEKSKNKELNQLIEDKALFRKYMISHQLADLIKLNPITLTADELLSLLRPLTPRLYSIASSQQEVEDEVHLTVALVANDHNGDIRYGGATQFLANSEEGQQVKVYVEPNSHFRLPENPQTPVIMIGPGTGIAPFRSFLQERSANGEKGNTWLFFGNPHFETDFLYQTEIQQFLKSGVLSQLDLAFSRDQDHKIYVQQRIKEQGQTLWQWLENGAHIYVCGDADRMAKDVHQALIQVIANHGRKDEQQAVQYLDNLRAQKRYQKDVY